MGMVPTDYAVNQAYQESKKNPTILQNPIALKDYVSPWVSQKPMEVSKQITTTQEKEDEIKKLSIQTANRQSSVAQIDRQIDALPTDPMGMKETAIVRAELLKLRDSAQKREDREREKAEKESTKETDWDKFLKKTPINSFVLEGEDIKQRLPNGKLGKPLDEYMDRPRIKKLLESGKVKSYGDIPQDTYTKYGAKNPNEEVIMKNTSNQSVLVPRSKIKLDSNNNVIEPKGYTLQ
jgi:hypothetical protein